ncbi:glycosyltransferase [Actinosynnema sp. NPDC020468]|uniref:glycosyltransferase n=1 Tax=Actinosynnema sp. NPDC020468 TaxID=3154488 RepID=UPI0033D7FF8C
MRVLLSTIGSRGDVQPVLALACRLAALGREVRVCAPPDFRAWVEDQGIPFVPLGPRVRPTAKAGPPVAPSPEMMRRIAEATVATQFEVLPAAAEGCDVVIAAGALQIALRSIAELRGIRYHYAAYCPISLPSPHHAPPAWRGEGPNADAEDNTELWARDARRWRDSWGVALDAHRTALGLPPVPDVRGHIVTDRPWLAADPVLAPWPGAADLDVVPTGAWLLPDGRPLPPEVEAFLDAGEPPVYFGFGSIRTPSGLGEAMLHAARAHGRRAIVSRGWADLVAPEDPDCLSLGEVNHPALFRRVAAVVHHGGAGTTTAATRAGAPQVVVPQHYDQHYFARRVHDLGLGAAHPAIPPTADSLSEALAHALAPRTAATAERVAGTIRGDGTDVAARLLDAADRG